MGIPQKAGPERVEGAPHGAASGPATSEPEAQLVRRAARDPEAFAALYRRHYSAIQRYLRRRLGDPDAVEDAVAETFVCALRQIPRYRERGVPFRAWLYRLATGQAARHYRRAARWSAERLEVDPPRPRAPQEPCAARVRDALLRLAPKHQAVLALHYLEGFSVEEVALTLGCRAGTVKSRLARGRAALKGQLEQLERRERGRR